MMNKRAEEFFNLVVVNAGLAEGCTTEKSRLRHMKNAEAHFREALTQSREDALDEAIGVCMRQSNKNMAMIHKSVSGTIENHGHRMMAQEDAEIAQAIENLKGKNDG